MEAPVDHAQQRPTRDLYRRRRNRRGRGADRAPASRTLATRRRIGERPDATPDHPRLPVQLHRALETDAEAAHASEVISTLTSHHPCRAIVLSVASNTSTSELSASISAHCHLAGTGQKQVCCEQIAIHASGQSVAHLGSAVLPLLESDLPTIVWWQGNFLKRIDLFRRLVAVADRIIYDTSAWPDPQSQLAGLARVLTEHPALQLYRPELDAAGIVAETRRRVFRRTALLRRTGANPGRSTSCMAAGRARVCARCCTAPGSPPNSAGRCQKPGPESTSPSATTAMRRRWASCPSPSRRTTPRSRFARITAKAPPARPSRCPMPAGCRANARSGLRTMLPCCHRNSTARPGPGL